MQRARVAASLRRGHPPPLTLTHLCQVCDPSELASDDAWPEAFGPVLVMLRESYELLGHRVESRLVQYEDGPKVDFSLVPVDLVPALAEAEEGADALRLGYRVLVRESQS